ncbi:MAG TPA: RagB/SusD family nutrient uptake outer membrane protein [Chryseosolibacter sp.]|nr:RagB/SusD family nutrient uptake outer membrane protein [Chryseosolibacter sp.]
MKPKISIQYLIPFVCFIISPLGCSDDFLDKKPQGNLIAENFPVTAADAEQAVNAVYNTMRISEFNFGLFPIMDIMSDDAHKGSNPGDQRSTIGPFDNFTHIAGAGQTRAWWNTLYLGIKRANVVIEQVPPIVMETELRDRFIGEAKFLRALYYFDLVRAFGGVPSITSVQAPIQQERATPEAVLTLIEQDLTDAIAALPEKDEYGASDLGRATKGAAHALKARVHLWQSEFSDAETHAMAVINSGKYSLEMNFENANSKIGEFGIESVFEVGAIGEESLTNGGNQYANVQGVRGNPNRGWGFNRPSEDLKAAFEPGDIRLDATVLNLGEVMNDTIVIEGDGTTPDGPAKNSYTYPGFPDGIVEVEAYNQKVWTPGINVPTQFGHNRRIIRYADVLLMAAEALNENNKPGDALTYLNMVRDRADLEDVTELNKDLLRDIIFHERRVELALEGHRFWDLVRTGRADDVLEPYGFIAGKHELLAIPQAEIDLAGLEQNEAWK